MAEEDADKAEMKSYFQRAHDDWQRRLSLWSAIGNVGGLVAIGSVVADKFENAKLLALLFPSLWSFAIGTTAALIFNIMMWSTYADFISSHRTTGEFVPPGGFSTLLIGLSGILSAVCFMFGYLYPVFSLTVGYLAKGGF